MERPLHSAMISAAATRVEALPAATAPRRRSPRVRLEVDRRRAQLLVLGRELLTTRGYDDLTVAAIARAAGISQGLIYHYFRSKRIFYVEILREVAEELLRHSAPPRNVAPMSRLRAGVEAYLAFVERNKSLFCMLFGRRILQDVELQRTVESTRSRFFERLLPEDVAGAPITRNAFQGWIGFIESTVLDWIERPELTQGELSDLFVGVFREIVAQRAAPRRRVAVGGR